MRTTAPVQDERRLLGELDRTLEALKQTTGLEGRVIARQAETGIDERADALVEIDADGQRHRYLVDAKTRVDRLTTLGHLKARLDLFGERHLLFAPYITTNIAKRCRQLDIAFLDTVGNAYLQAPGLYIFIAGEKPEGLNPQPLRIGRGGTATALRVVFVLLCKPKLLNAPYRDIVDAAGVALGAVGWVFHDLKARGLVAGGRNYHTRRFLEPIRIFDEWVTNFPIKLRPKLNLQRFKAPDPDWWKKANLTHIGAFWGGDVAAARLTDYLKPETCTIYLDRHQGRTALKELVATHRLRADPDGNVEIIDKFWNLPPDPKYPDLAPPILIYADLVATLSPRNVEVAKLIREQFIDNALRQL